MHVPNSFKYMENEVSRAAVVDLKVLKVNRCKGVKVRIRCRARVAGVAG